jgi:hypothetical protein
LLSVVAASDPKDANRYNKKSDHKRDRWIVSATLFYPGLDVEPRHDEQQNHGNYADQR